MSKHLIKSGATWLESRIEWRMEDGREDEGLVTTTETETETETETLLLAATGSGDGDSNGTETGET